LVSLHQPHPANGVQVPQVAAAQGRDPSGEAAVSMGAVSGMALSVAEASGAISEKEMLSANEPASMAKPSTKM
jgi:hypothetical protein